MLKAGFATVDITPPVGTPIGGNYRDDYASRGVHDPLCAHCMVADDGEHQVAIVSADLLGVRADMVRRVRESVHASCGLEPGAVMVAATHTHSGPDTLGLDERAMASEAVVDGLVEGIASAVANAWAARVPARAGYGAGREETVSNNRRLRLKDGTVHMNWEGIAPDDIAEVLGPTDPGMGVLKVVDASGRLMGVLVNYTLHPAILAGDNLLLSSDYPGAIYRRMGESLGKDTTVVFANGTEGNINHINAFDPQQGRGFEEVERIGGILAGVALSILPGIETAGDLEVRSSVKSVDIPRRQLPEDRFAWAEEVLAKWDGKSVNMVDGLPDELYAREALALKELQDEPVAVEIQAILIGETVLVALPAEVFVEFGLEIKKHSPFAKTMIVGLANDWVGYVPTRRAFEEGGYEPQPARSSQLDEAAGDTMVQEALGLLNGLMGKEAGDDGQVGSDRGWRDSGQEDHPRGYHAGGER